MTLVRPPSHLSLNLVPFPLRAICIHELISFPNSELFIACIYTHMHVYPKSELFIVYIYTHMRVYVCVCVGV